MFIDLGELITQGKARFVEDRVDSDIYYIEIEGQSYIFKPSEFNHNEIFASVCAEELGLKSVEYFLASYQGVSGVISKNFKKEGATYTDGYTILEKFYDEKQNYLIDLGLPLQFDGVYANAQAKMKKEIYVSIVTNNLETIWLALENYYRGKNIEHIMRQIVDLFMFSLLCNDCDKHACNWEVEEYNGELNLVPIYDNERSFVFADEYLALHVSIEDFDKNPYDVVLREFLSKSSEEFVDRFLSMYEILYSNGKFEEIINRVEDKIGDKYRIPYSVYEKLEKAYYAIGISIEQVINEMKCNKSYN